MVTDRDVLDNSQLETPWALVMHQKLSLMEILLCLLHVKTTAHLQTAAHNIMQM